MSQEIITDFLVATVQLGDAHSFCERGFVDLREVFHYVMFHITTITRRIRFKAALAAHEEDCRVPDVYKSEKLINYETDCNSRNEGADCPRK